ncbi:MAG: ORF6N domain-containing protein [Bacteroidales bacterium]|nr:ORF6N domain-containing protein [Bacteroidales bacterium]
MAEHLQPAEITIQQQILVVRDQRVMLDFELAALYGVETKRLNEQVRRNIERFPADFMFQLTQGEWNLLKYQLGDLRSQIATSNVPENQDDIVLRSQIATAKAAQKSRSLPYAFTELGVAMLSSVLRSPTAIQVNISIMRAFVAFRHLTTRPLPDSNTELRKEVKALRDELEEIISDQNDINEMTQAQLDAISEALAELQSKEPITQKRQRIGFVKEEQ